MPDTTEQLSPTVIAVLASAIGLAIGAWLAIVFRRARETIRARAHNKRGKRAEQAAGRLLEERGYRIIARQSRKSYVVRLGEVDQPVDLIIDYVVEKDGERFAAEVKTGGATAGIERADTRRQLLEYQLALGCKRVLLVDPERLQITAFAFPIPRPESKPAPKPRSASLTAAVATLVVVIVAFAAWVALGH
jgi:Holliday junction resolvase-like predicted endonuclease